MTRHDLREVEYIGDGAYIGNDGYQVWVFTSDGIEEKNFIALDWAMLKEINGYVTRINKPTHKKEPSHEFN